MLYANKSQGIQGVRYQKASLICQSRSRRGQIVRRRSVCRLRCQYNAKEFSEVEELQKLSQEVVEKLGGTSLYLVGMMGSGKSTVGRYMAHLMQYYFFDTDELIEKAAKISVAEIFEKEGEEEFRNIETQTLQQLAPFTRCLISTGGGAVLRTDNWAHMQHGVVIWVDGPPKLLAARLFKSKQQGSRPLLNEAEGEIQSLEQKLANLIMERQGKYQQADLQVSIVGEGGDVPGSASIEEVCKRILTGVNEKIDEQARIMEEKQKFLIENKGDIPITMATTEGPYVSQTQTGALNEHNEQQQK
eukprot:TRINITY_DN10468_c0_g1_i1.p1 TRINITY_DN10468_c0_g1~~TRINITY_DN10468_c0_g1_i1.p1  ORF type:complete len:309 (-),score=45.44 TRINITY_DN10468_c0_g1_i1:182-1087(-)